MKISERPLLYVIQECCRKSSFWNFLNSGIEEYGSLQIELAAIALLCWLIIYISIFKGAKLMGKGNSTIFLILN